MNNNTVTIRQATEKWVSGFNAIPMALIEKAYPYFDDELETHITELECMNCGSTDIENDVCLSCEGTDIIEGFGLPMWNTLWSFDSALDEQWALDNLEVMRECGFFVYESDEIGVFIGINGAGYDFYEAHWIPLYKARGLKWHNIEE